jgi:hypothetical protein
MRRCDGARPHESRPGAGADSLVPNPSTEKYFLAALPPLHSDEDRKDGASLHRSMTF